MYLDVFVYECDFIKATIFTSEIQKLMQLQCFNPLVSGLNEKDCIFTILNELYFYYSRLTTIHPYAMRALLLQLECHSLGTSHISII